MNALDEIKEHYSNSVKRESAESTKSTKPVKTFTGDITNAKDCYDYVRDVLKGRFELGEKAISKDTYYSYYYAYEILKDRFELGEETISKDADFSYHYALNVLKLNP